MMNIHTLIDNKASQLKHSRCEIEYIVKGYTQNLINDTEMTGWIRAIYDNGMEFKETLDYTNAIINSGERINFKKDGIYIDKHSTGGVGDKVSLVLGPILAACGCYVPMIVGRALGHTGGTLDKLESIPNYNGLLKISEFKRIVEEVGISIIGQTNEICPADMKIYQLRSKTNTIASFPLICGSIMSKKIAEGIGSLVLDIKTGNGAFMESKEEAFALGKYLQRIGNEFSLDVKFAITNMNQPLGNYSGLLCEVTESMATLKGHGPSDLLEVVHHLGALCLEMANIKNRKDKIEQVISDGSAYDILCKMIYEHGGKLDKIKHTPKYQTEIKVKDDGHIHYKNTKEIGYSILNINKNKNQAQYDRMGGIEMIKKDGALVKKNDVIARIFGSNKNLLDLSKEIFENSFELKEQKIKRAQIIY